jgi:hypothetical protein
MCGPDARRGKAESRALVYRRLGPLGSSALHRFPHAGQVTGTQSLWGKWVVLANAPSWPRDPLTNDTRIGGIGRQLFQRLRPQRWRPADGSADIRGQFSLSLDGSRCGRDTSAHRRAWRERCSLRAATADQDAARRSIPHCTCHRSGSAPSFRLLALFLNRQAYPGSGSVGVQRGSAESRGRFRHGCGSLPVLRQEDRSNQSRRDA